MKKVAFILMAMLMVASCTPEDLPNETKSDGFACPAPDTNCNGVPDHEE